MKTGLLIGSLPLGILALSWAWTVLPKAGAATSPPLRGARTAFGLDKVGLGQPQTAAALRELGAGFTTGHAMLGQGVGPTRLELQQFDAWVAEVQSLGLEPVLSLAPGPGGAYGDTSCFPETPERLRAWTDFVRLLVERYDGDAIDDAPALRAPLRHWKLLQEWPISWTGTVDEYLRLLDLTYAVVKDADPQAKVITVGVASRIALAMVLKAGLLRPGFRPQQPQGADATNEAVQAIERILREGRYDIVDLHAYENMSIVDAKIAVLRRLMPAGTDIWMLEAGGPFLTRAQGYTDQLNAEMVVKIHAQALGSGAGRVVWALAPAKAGGYWDFEPWTLMPLLERLPGGGHREKPSYFTYRRLTRMLGGFTSAADFSPGLGLMPAERVFAYRFRRPQGFVHVLWSGSDRGGKFSIRTATSARWVRVTQAVVDHDRPAPRGRVQPVVKGQAVIALSAEPVYVEELGHSTR